MTQAAARARPSSDGIGIAWSSGVSRSSVSSRTGHAGPPVDRPQARKRQHDDQRQHRREHEDGAVGPGQRDHDGHEDRPQRQRGHHHPLEDAEDARQDLVADGALEDRAPGDVHQREPDAADDQQQRRVDAAREADGGERRAEQGAAGHQHGRDAVPPDQPERQRAAQDPAGADRRGHDRRAGLPGPEDLDREQDEQHVGHADHQLARGQDGHDQARVAVRRKRAEAAEHGEPRGRAVDGVVDERLGADARGIRPQPEHEQRGETGDAGQHPDDRPGARHDEDRGGTERSEEDAGGLGDARDGVGRGELGRAAGEGRQQRVVRRPHEGERDHVGDGDRVDDQRMPAGQHPGRDQGHVHREQPVGDEDHALAAEPVGQRRERGSEDRGRHELDQRHDAHGLGAGRLVRVQQQGDPGAVLHRRERDVRELDAAQRRVPEDLGGDAPRRSQPIQQAPHRIQCASAGAPTGPPSWRVGVVPARMGAWRSSLPPSSRPSAATTGRRPSCPRGPTTTRRSSTGSRTTSCGATGCWSRARRTIAEPGSFLVREVLDESVLLVRGRDDEIRAFYNVCRHRGTAVEERDCGTGRPLPVPVPRLDLRPRGQAHPGQAHRGPRGLHLRGLRPATHPDRDLAGLRVPVLRRRVGDAAAPGAARRPRRPVRAVRLHDAALGAPGHLRGRRQLEVHRRELLASATTARASTRSSTG